MCLLLVVLLYSEGADPNFIDDSEISAYDRALAAYAKVFSRNGPIIGLPRAK